ncbi:MAG: ATP-grasp domain-containing protein [Oligoflexales bacterium]|nr:ATP-grasp domain-containing protein [Oligoflexales bacterium]
MAQSSEDPAVRCADRVFFEDELEHSLSEIFRLATVVSIESELIPQSHLNYIRSHLDPRKIMPPIATILTCSNKLSQKKILRQSNLPILKWLEFKKSVKSISSWISDLITTFPFGCVLKWSRGGYDGKGVLKLTENEFTLLKQDNNDSLRSRIELFIEEGWNYDPVVYAEELCNFKYEAAVVAVANKAGEITCYPSVLTQQSDGVCSRVYSAKVSELPTQSINSATIELTKKIGAVFNIVGTFAVEFFVNYHDDIFINEIAPRVHNSGHYTLDAANCSQFENHWGALLDLPITTIECSDYFAMLNILGPKNLNTKILRQPDFNTNNSTPKSFLHWYFKKESRPSRKLGHINVKANTKSELIDEFKFSEERILSWEKTLREIGKQ